MAAEAQAPPKVPRVGYVFSTTSSDGRSLLEAFRQGLRELGCVEGQSVTLEIRWAEGMAERFPDLAADLVRRKVDVLVVATTPGTLAARDATTSIPIVMVAVDDPVRSGLVASLARPGGNLTGVSKGVQLQSFDVRRPEDFEGTFAKTAKTLGLTIPRSVLLRADHVIQ